MKNDYIQDERILSERRIIQSKGYSWILLILMISIIVQQVIMKAPFPQYAVEFFIVIGCGFYNSIATFKRGIDIWNPRGESKKKILVNTLIAGAVSVFILVVLYGNHQIDNLAFYFISFIVFFFAIRLIMIGLINKKQNYIDKELNDDDTTE